MSKDQAATLPRLGEIALLPPFPFRSPPNPWLLPWLAAGNWWRWATANLGVTLLYIALGTVVGRFFGAYGLFPAPIWLPAGIACVASMVGGLRLLPGVFAGSFIINWLHFASPAQTALLISATNTLGPWVGAMVTLWLRPESGLFTRFRGVAGFILGGVLLHAAISAAGGTLALSLLHRFTAEEAYRCFAGWWLCDSGGAFLFAPALLLWLGAERTPDATRHPFAWLDHLVLLGTVAAAVLLFAVPGLGRHVRADAVFLLTVPLSWITLRISLRAAYTLLSLICIAATVGTVLGEGPFHAPGVINPLQSVGLMTVLFAMDALTLIALTSERREAEAQLVRAHGTLEEAEANTELYRRAALTDPLTEIGNRRYFLAQAGTVLEDARQAGRRYSLLLLDLDHFKRLNDSSGHAAGDAALRAVARTLTEHVREQDILARIGGEEFALLLPEVDLAEAAAIAERLRRAVARLAIRPAFGPPLRLTASFGVAERLPGDRGIDDILQRADAAVYAAKAKGRNRVELACPAEAAGQG